jgi:hypothetical protein
VSKVRKKAELPIAWGIVLPSLLKQRELGVVPSLRRNALHLPSPDTALHLLDHCAPEVPNSQGGK